MTNQFNPSRPAITIRATTAADAEAIFAYSRMPQVYVPAAIAPPRDVADVEWRLSNLLDTDQLYVITLAETGTVIGNIDMYWQIGQEGLPDTQNRELGYALSPEYWHRGVMTAALTQLLTKLFNQGLVSVTSEVYADNQASIKLLNRLGFQRFTNPYQPAVIVFKCTADDFQK